MANQREIMRKCSVCHQPKMIKRVLAGSTITGSMTKHRQQVLLCEQCDLEHSAIYAESMKCHVHEQVAQIDEMIAAYPKQKLIRE